MIVKRALLILLSVISVSAASDARALCYCNCITAGGAQCVV